MKWIVGHPARSNMGAVVGKAAWQTPLVGLLELVLAIGSDPLMTTRSRMKAVNSFKFILVSVDTVITDLTLHPHTGRNQLQKNVSTAHCFPYHSLLNQTKAD